MDNPLAPIVPIDTGLQGQSALQDAGPTDPAYWSQKLGALDAMQTKSATGNLIAAQQVDPDHAAIARTLSPVLGLPASAIEADPKMYSSMFALRADRATLGTDALLRQWIAADPGNAKVAQGDIQQLGVVGSFFRAMRQGYQQSALQSQSGQIGMNVMAGRETPGQVNQFQTDQERLAAMGAQPHKSPLALPPLSPNVGLMQARTGIAPPRVVAPSATSVARGVGGFVGSTAQSVVGAIPDAAAGAAVGAATGAPVGGVGAIPGAVVGGISGLGLGMAGNAGIDTSGQVYAKLNSAVDRQGKPIPAPVKDAAAIGAGIVVAGLGSLGADTLTAPVKAMANKFVGDVAAEAVTRPVLSNAIGRLAGSAAKAGVTGAVVSGGQTAAQILAPSIAKAITSPDFQTVFNDPAKRQAAINSIVDQMEIGAIAYPAMELPMHGLSIVADGARAASAQDSAAKFDGLMQAAQASKTRQRAPDAFQGLVKSHVEAGGPESVYVPADAMMHLYQSLGVEPGAPDDPFRFVPDMADQMERAQASGADIEIPMDAYVAHMPAEIDHMLRAEGQLRFEPDGMTAQEAQEFEAQHGGALQADHDYIQQVADELSKPGEDQDDRAVVAEDVHGQLKRAGYTDDTANQHAALMAERYATRGARLGVSPLELYRGEGIKVERAATPTPIPPDAYDRVIDTVRKGTPQPTDRQLFGPSLAEFLSTHPGGKDENGALKPGPEGGLRDEGGEIKAVGGADWHKAQKFRSKLINPKGQNLDDATLRAWQHGYFPDQADRPDINYLIEKLREDINGNPVRPEPTPEASDKATFRDAVEHVSQVLNHEGIDPKEASNEEIKAALERHASERTLMQSGDLNQGSSAPRGSITMGENARTITLFRQANLSTLLHELGHQFLDELERDANREDAPEQLRDDLTTVHKWLGVSEGERAGVEAHEKWARGFEAYLRDGQAPSNALAGAFQKFAAWLTRIYRSVVSLGGAVPPKIAGVMDRLLATDDAIDQARGGLGLDDPLFKSPSDAGMNAAEWKRYQRGMEAAKRVAYEKVLRKAMKIENDRRTAEWADAANEARPDVEQSIKSRSAIRAWTHLAEGHDPANPGVEAMPIKLDRAEAILGGSVDRLPKGVIGANGMSPDTIAPMFGYDSGDQMLDDLIAENGARQAMSEQMGKPLSLKKYVGELVDRGVDDAVRAQLGDVLSDGSIEQAAMEAAHNETQADVLTTEMRAAAKLAGTQPLELRHIKAWVKGKMADSRMTDAVRVNSYRRAEAKAARDAQRALLRGKHLDAFQAKQRQLVAHLFATEAQDLQHQWDRATTYWRNVAKSPTRAGTDQAFLDQAHGVLARLGMIPGRDPGELARGLEGKPLDAFIEHQRGLGYEIIAPDFIRSGAALPHYTDMTVDQFQGAADAIRSLLKNGRMAQEVTIDGKRVALDEIVNEAVARLDRKRSLPKSDRLRPEQQRNLEGLMFAMAHKGRVVDSYLGKIEQFMNEWDGADQGPFQSIFDRIKQAGYDERDLGAEVAKQWHALRAGLPEDWAKSLKQKHTASELINRETGRPHVFSRDEMLAIALNVGNASNLDKLTRGFGWDENATMSYLHRTMTKPDWDFVQGVWDIFEGLFPRIEAMQRRVTGVGMDKVDHTPVDTQFGTYSGGYYPVIYDAARSPTPEKADQAGELFDQNYGRATTPKGHTVSRTDYAAPLSLNTSQIGWKLSQAIHDLTHREAIMDAWKFFNRKEITAAIRDKVGDEYTRTPNKWLRDVANKANVDEKMLGFLNKMVRRVSAVGIGFRITTVMKHGLTALSNSISTVGARDFASAAREFSSPDRARATAKWVMARSGEMRHRFESIDNNARESLQRILGNHTWVQNVERFGYYPVSAMDFASAMPTWLAAYQRGMADGMDDADAVLHADRQVRFAHGASNPEDLPEVQRSQLMKLFTMFYSFANHMYNQGMRPIVRGSVSAARGLAEGDHVGARRDMVAVAGRSFSYMVMPGLISALLANSAYESNESWFDQAGASILGEAAAGIPILRDLAQSILQGYPFQDSPLTDVATNAKATATDAARATGLSDKPVSDRWLQHAITTAGYATGLPLGQAGESAQYLWDIHDGEADPKTLGQFLHGLAYGPTTVKK